MTSFLEHNIPHGYAFHVMLILLSKSKKNLKLHRQRGKTFVVGEVTG